MSDYTKGFFLGVILSLLIVGVYLCKVNFQFNEAHYADLQEQIKDIEIKYGQK